ncbi:Gfo/Idh/MocA family oxidoreductase [Alicyclobacillus fastidiosus]|uniref:Gfo/Idh/MocA family oxidoreductase n=1 Tax=Alicyclobacillus fastidiosus TaxID=392011 RepID=A0ABY6ZIN2_9BACL|nr:Gfo/Idh/MocA family oxidoreductase [Alicyclobacillus fastidiosus]WAH42691.1 Gfo/Idh/MocA family oxidoreductase [Alicyclobacillus fastidiosus]GMA64577.1 oxidoreductase [Alicyclobacillus fastidiosus]
MRKLNVGLIGGGFMSKAHSLAYATMPMFFWPAPAIPVRKAVADVNLELATDARDRFGFEKAYGDWRELINDPEIDIVDIVTPNHIHAEIAIAAAQAGKHILCEKPLARTAAEARTMLEAVEQAGVTNMVAFNYRRTPAIALAKKFIEEGRIGKILNFRGTYLQDWSADPNSPLSWRFQKSIAGSGALGDIAAHVIDIARYLVGDFESVNALVKTWIPERPVQTGGLDQLGTVKSSSDVPKKPVDVDDEVSFLIKFQGEAIGSIESTRNAHGRNNFITFEIHGETGSIFFNYERRDELQVCFADDPVDAKGFRTIYTGPAHPYGEGLWPIPALGIGYSETKIVECYDFVRAIVDSVPCSPNFRDGYEIARICDAVLESGKTQNWVNISSID